jgi:vacuolar protein sorting-associated protein 33A
MSLANPPSVTSPTNAVTADVDSQFILPPPTAANPLPFCITALSLDNADQLVSLLQTDPRTTNAISAAIRQVLVFGTDSLRTLLLRQVLNNPLTERGPPLKKKHNWETQGKFTYPTGLYILSTLVLKQDSTTSLTKKRASPNGGNNNSEPAPLPTPAIDDSVWKDVEVVTIFLQAFDLKQTQDAARAIKDWNQQSKKKTASTRIHYRLIYLPRVTAVIYKILSQAGLGKNMALDAFAVSIHSLPIYTFPLEKDLVSLEYDLALREADLDGTPSALVTTVAQSLVQLQAVAGGPVPRIQSYGTLAEEVVRKMTSLAIDDYLTSNRDKVTTNVTAGPVVGGSIAAMVLMDRKVDLVTPMLTPLTYEGLLDDVVGIDCGYIHVNVNIINPPEDNVNDNSSQGSDSKKQNKEALDEIVDLAVNGSDSLYAEVRNQHVEQFGQFLQNQAMALRESHANFTSKGKHKDLSEIHQFVKQIPVFTQNLRSLTNHIHLAELVKHASEEAAFRERWQTERSILEGETCYDVLEDLVASQHPPYRFFRLLCLQSLCSGVIKSSRYDSIRRDVVQTYGYEYLFVLQNLEKMGLLRRREGLWMDSASPFAHIRKSLLLIHAEVNTVEPDDIAYVSSGYAPLSVRILQTAILQGWSHPQREEVLRELPGSFLDIVQYNPPEDLTTALKRSAPATLAPSAFSAGLVASGMDDQSQQQQRKPTLVMVYIGGITYMEIASLRFLSKRPSFPYHILIVTTKIINGTQLLQSMS